MLKSARLAGLIEFRVENQVLQIQTQVLSGYLLQSSQDMGSLCV